VPDVRGARDGRAGLKRRPTTIPYFSRGWRAWYRATVAAGGTRRRLPFLSKQPTAERAEWPDDVPRGCPPASAPDTDGVVYRRDAGPADWQNAIQNGRFVGKPPCLRASLSCCVSLDDLKQKLGIRTDWAEAPKIVAARLLPSHGKIQQTGSDSSHYSLWLRRAALERIHELFKAVE
jgi:hypothetical protein